MNYLYFIDFYLVRVPSASFTSNLTRAYDKKQACYFCNKLYGKIARHLEDCHSSEECVAIALSFNKKSKSRSRAMEKIKLMGNYHHNAKVLSCGKGELIVCKRPKVGDTADAKDFLPCPHCLGFLKKTELWRHARTCHFNEKTAKIKEEGLDSETKSRNIISESTMLLLPYTCPKATSELQESVLSQMKNDNISFTCKHDDLIIMFGSSIIEKVGKKNANYVSQRMRQLARLLATLNDEEVEGNLQNFLCPEKFDLVLQGVKKLCLFSKEIGDDKQKVSIPSLALKLGHSLNKCAQILRGKGLREKDAQLLTNSKAFLELMEYEWSDRISSSSLSTMVKNKKNKVEMLPLTSDLELVRKYVVERMGILMTELKKRATPETWAELAQVTAARTIMFNKRRSGEASRLMLKDYINRPDWKQAGCGAIKLTLDPLEKRLCERYTDDYVYMYSCSGTFSIDIDEIPRFIQLIKTCEDIDFSLKV